MNTKGFSRSRLQTYYRVTKPGIVYGNLMTAAAGFLLASRGSIAAFALLLTLVGIGLTIAGACVLNNCLDRRIDALMERTKSRAMVTGELSLIRAVVYGGVLVASGLGVLWVGVSALVAVLGITAVISYVLVYGYVKRRSPIGTLVGTIPGALPLAAGYVAVRGSLDLGAYILFAIMVAWQMPHFYGIAVRRQKDYASAGIPVLPVRRGVQWTRVEMIVYILLFGVATALLGVYGYAGLTYLVVMAILTCQWLWLAGRYQDGDPTRWAGRIFGFSLHVLLVFSLMISLDAWLP